MSDAHDHGHHASGGDHGHGHHDPNLAHHFASMEQQVESGKLGMWVFLATEILMFGGLFCAYAIYRGNHPEVFLYAHQSLNTQLGAINTAILLASSFTMAWAVLAATRGQKMLMLVMLALTFGGGIGFMGIKTVEYIEKYDKSLWVGGFNAFYREGGDFKNPEKLAKADAYITHGSTTADKPAHVGPDQAGPDAHPPADDTPAQLAVDPQTPVTVAAEAPVAAAPVWPPVSPDRASIAPARNATPAVEALLIGTAPVGLDIQPTPGPGDGKRAYPGLDELSELDKTRLNTFFQIYFVMTGLHGLHVLIGMGLIAWVFVRGLNNAFTPAYNAPVEIVGLYWHLVDLIWIFLFPLLYLIH